MKIVLVYPTIGLGPSYSCGVGSIAAVLREAGHQVTYRNLASLEDVAGLCQAIETDAPQLIAFAATSCQFEQLKRVIPQVRAVSKAVVVCGGIHPTVQPDCLDEIPELDAIVRGEGEFPLLDLAQAMQDGRDYSHIPNLWVRTGGAVVRNELRPLIADLDVLPFPDLDLAETQRAIDDQAGMHRMIFSRGCSFRCPYCSNHALSDIYRGKGVYHRLRSPEKALEEIQRDADRFKFRFLFFDDDTITLNREWFGEFFTRYRERFKFPFYCNLRPGTLSRPMAELLKAAGAKGVALGIEHGDEQFRKSVLGRGHTNQEIRRTVELCRNAGIDEIYGQVMIGLPFETMELHLQTVRLCRSLEIIPFRYVYQPYPGTSLARTCEENHWLPDKSTYVERREAVIDFPQFSREQIQVCFDVFSVLVRVKFLPLRVPFVPTEQLWKGYRFCTGWMVPRIRELCHAVPLLRRWVIYRPQA
ncbi:MAG: radical SAM protein [Verrucomicrobia bacterium]|nr:radical SAM protein [Verrucomicrobiota bacterium]